MNIFRIILSLGILAASITWMSLDFLKREFFSHEVSWVWENKKPDAKAWEISTLIMNEVESDFKRNGISINRSSRTINFRTEASQNSIIANIVRDINLDIANFDEHNKKMIKKIQAENNLKKSTLQNELSALLKLEMKFEGLLEQTSKLKPKAKPHIQPENKKVTIENKTPKTEPKKIDKKNKIIQVVVKDVENNNIDTLFSELLNEENLIQTNSSANTKNEIETSFSIESSLKDLQVSLSTMKDLFNNSRKNQTQLFEKKYKAILSKIEKLQIQCQNMLIKQRHLLKDELSKNISGELNRMKNELKMNYQIYITSLENNMQIQSSEIKSIQIKKIEFLNSYLKERKQTIQNEKIRLESTIENRPMYGKVLLTSSPSEPVIKDIKHSYSRFMIGIFACLFLNMIWEITLQRSNAKR